MSTLETALDGLQAAIAAAMPSRIVTQDLKDFADRADADLTQGVLTIVAGGEDGFANYIGREADLGELDLDLIAQVKVAANTAPSAVTAAEGVLIDEVKDFCKNVPPVVDQALLVAWRGSKQLEHPYGWVVFRLKVRLNVL